MFPQQRICTAFLCHQFWAALANKPRQLRSIPEQMFMCLLLVDVELQEGRGCCQPQIKLGRDPRCIAASGGHQQVGAINK